MGLFSSKCRNCGSNNTASRGFIWSMIGFLPFIHNKYCLTCHSTFRKVLMDPWK